MKADKSYKPPPMLLRPEQAATSLSMSRSHFDLLTKSGDIGPRSIVMGKLRLWSKNELQQWVDHRCPSREEWDKLKLNHTLNPELDNAEPTTPTD